MVAGELKAETSIVLTCDYHLQHNITREEARALKELKQDMMVILTADKGMTMVVLDKEGHINKVEGLLAQRDTYRPLEADPTKEIQKQTYQHT